MRHRNLGRQSGAGRYRREDILSVRAVGCFFYFVPTAVLPLTAVRKGRHGCSIAAVRSISGGCPHYNESTTLSRDERFAEEDKTGEKGRARKFPRNLSGLSCPASVRWFVQGCLHNLTPYFFALCATSKARCRLYSGCIPSTCRLCL